jgi:hypothetical protein
MNLAEGRELCALFYLILFREVHSVCFFLFLGKKLKEMYREQNYIFSFTFVYKSKTACLIKHLFKKKKGKKRKNKHPQTTFSSFFLDSEDFSSFLLWFWFYFT